MGFLQKHQWLVFIGTHSGTHTDEPHQKDNWRKQMILTYSSRCETCYFTLLGSVKSLCSSSYKMTFFFSHTCGESLQSNVLFCGFPPLPCFFIFWIFSPPRHKIGLRILAWYLFLSPGRWSASLSSEACFLHSLNLTNEYWTARTFLG